MYKRLSIIFLFLYLISYIQASNAQVFIPHAYWQCKTGYTTQTVSTSTDFTLGTFSNTNISGNHVALTTGNATGTYTSPVIDMFGGCVPLIPWLTFSWSTPLPFGKESPTTDETAVNYANISTGLNTNLVLYLNMNETVSGTAPGGKDFTDKSTSGAHGTRSGNPIFGVTGKLLKAVTTSSGNYIDLGTVLGSLGTSDTTQAAWIKTTNASAGVVINNRNVDPDRTMSLHIGWWAGSATGNGFAYFSNDGGGCEVGAIGSSNVADGNWHHLVGVRSGLTNYYIYVDGVLQGTNNITIGSGCNASAADSTAPWQVGRHGAWNTTFDGSIDELMMWRRAMTATEVQKLFQRGGNRLKFQVKSCTATDCSDIASWLGPDGTNATFFTEINNNGLPVTGLGTVLTGSPVMTYANFPSLTLPTNRFFQYKATFETDNTTILPEISSVTMTRGCLAGSASITTSGTWTLPAGCTSFTATVNGAGGGSARMTSGTKAAGGRGGQAVKSFSGLNPGSVFTITIGSGGLCSQTGGTGGYNGGSGGNANACTVGGAGSGGGTGGTFGTKIGAGCNGGTGGYGGAGGGGGAGGSMLGGGGGGATSISFSGTDYVVAGGGGGAGSADQGTGGVGGAACSAASGYNGGAGGNASGSNDPGGGGGGGACYCLGGTCNANPTTSGGTGGTNAGTTCVAANNGSNGSVSITYP